MGYSSLLWEPIPQLIPTVVRTGTGTCTARLGWDSTAGRMGQYRIGAVSCWLIFFQPSSERGAANFS
jgi:hypothetical protein